MSEETTGSNQVAEAKPHLRISALRPWLFRIIAAVVIPALVFILLEVALRVAGYGYPAAALVKCEVNGRSVYRSNSKFGWRFFPPEISRELPPFIVPADKPLNSYRIFILGESAAAGEPDTSFAFGRMLRVMLRRQYPSVNFEVFTAAMPAINSHGVVQIAKDCARLKPDLFVVYMGNNEVMGPYGAGTVFAPLSKHLLLIRMGLAVKATRLGQLMTRLAGITGRGRVPQGGQQIRCDDEQMQFVYSHFRHNLEDIALLSQKTGAKIIFSTVAVNLKDCPPFGSLHRPNLGESKKQFDTLYHHGIDLEKNGDLEVAIDSYLSAAEIDDTYAELQFRLGRCQWNLEQFDKARQSYARALELDTLRFRTDATINRIIREVGENQQAKGIYLVDAADELARQSPHDCPGFELFFEYVHLNFSGNYLLAGTVLDKVEQILPDGIKKQKAEDAGLASEALCVEMLAFTDYDNLRLTQENFIIISENKNPPFANQAYHDEIMAFWGQKAGQLKDNNGPNTPASVLEQYERAIKLDDSDRWLRVNFATFLWETYKNPLAAAGHYRVAIRQMPYDHQALAELARVEAMLGNVDLSLKHALKAVEIMPTNPIANFIAGMAYKMKGQPGRAQRYFIETIRLNPTLGLAYMNLGRVLSQQGKTEQAEQVYRKGIEIVPNDAYLHLSLAVLLRKKGLLEEAENELQKVIKLDKSVAALFIPLVQENYIQPVGKAH